TTPPADAINRAPTPPRGRDQSGPYATLRRHTDAINREPCPGDRYPTAGSPSSLIQTKLYRPRSGSDVIPRPHLFESLNAGLVGKITLVCAPAGFGKTTLLAEWVQTSERPTAWLSLDENDNELAVFVHSLTAALQSVFPDAFQDTASLFKAAQFPPPGHVAALLINEFPTINRAPTINRGATDVPEEIILVLDDYHLIRTSEVHSLLETLIEHLPAQLHLVLASRSDPPLPLARWLAQGHVKELRHADLRFTLEETEAFLTRVLGNELAHEAASALEERTEGWIAVLRQAALSLRNTADHAVFMERLGSYPARSISMYLVEEILSQQTPAVQELLERLSILEQFCAGVCAATLGGNASHEQVQAILNWLEHSNLLLVPLDEWQGWYRFHHLFQQSLQQRLQARISQEDIAALHRRASAWYAAQGLIKEAIQHVLAAGDGSNAAKLVEAHLDWAFKQEQWVQLEHWLRLLPEELIQSSPVLLVASAWIMQARGQLTDFPRLLTTAERLLATSGSGTPDLEDLQSRILHALIAVLWSEFQYFTGQAQASLQSARSALQWVAPGEEFVASLALFFLALSNQATGHEDVALVALNQVLRNQSTNRHDTARLLFAQALVYLAAGKLPQVENTARYLLGLAQEANLVLSQNHAHWLLGVVHYEWNKLDAAVYHFSAVIANQHYAHFWVVRDAMCGLALAYQAQGLGTQAQEVARTLLAWVQEQHNMSELMTAYAFCGQLALLQDEVEAAEQWLEMAGEQEVLGPMLFFKDPPITQARLLLAKGDEPSVARGQALLSQLLQHVETMYSTRKTIKVLALQAWAYDLQGRETEALEALERALALARPGRFIRTFADLPPLLRVLGELRKRRKARQAVDNKLDAYLSYCLAAMSPIPAQAVSTRELMRQEGLEPLTERELQILRLLEKDLTNREIARELVVTHGTVKLHTKHVYRKLSVNNRRAAVTLARELGLLTTAALS
ncbi:MAG TPA: LuxR C-terminal-related transcriptional regulator, partial [Ktedonobacteraceae bacterium]|nr:LuxR C-terminal-related transcriptional regulator [Ktedonobacteraceae bacterium]